MIPLIKKKDKVLFSEYIKEGSNATTQQAKVLQRTVESNLDIKIDKTILDILLNEFKISKEILQLAYPLMFEKQKDRFFPSKQISPVGIGDSKKWPRRSVQPENDRKETKKNVVLNENKENVGAYFNKRLFTQGKGKKYYYWNVENPENFQFRHFFPIEK